MSNLSWNKNKVNVLSKCTFIKTQVKAVIQKENGWRVQVGNLQMKEQKGH